MIYLPALKGIIIAILLWRVGTTFYQSLVITTVSATISGIFLLAGTYMGLKAHREDRETLHDIKRKVGATKRTNDEI